MESPVTVLYVDSLMLTLVHGTRTHTPMNACKHLTALNYYCT